MFVFIPAAHSLKRSETGTWTPTINMLPLYKQTLRFVADPYKRLRKQVVVGAAVALVLLFLFFLAMSGDHAEAPALNGGAMPPTPKVQQPRMPAVTPTQEADAPPVALTPPPVRADEGAASEKKKKKGMVREHDGAYDDAAEGADDGDEKPGDADVAVDADDGESSKKTSKMPWVVRLVLPLVAGYCFGFLGSVPIAGPTSAMVLKLGIQGKYQAALTIAFGGALSEATYAGIAFWGFGSFLAGAKFLLPVSKVLGAVMLTVVGIVFLKSDMKPSMEPELDSPQRKGRMGRARNEMYKNVLLGVTMSGINPALLATYTGAIASVYGTGMLEFNLFLAFVFAIGVCCGVSSWFYLLLTLLEKYKQRLKDQTIGLIMRCMGCFLLTLGLFCAKSSFEYFVWGSPPAAA
ncbi:Lysine exporter protein, partial [Globisporangium splendens]